MVLKLFLCVIKFIKNMSRNKYIFSINKLDFVSIGIKRKKANLKLNALTHSNVSFQDLFIESNLLEIISNQKVFFLISKKKQHFNNFGLYKGMSIDFRKKKCFYFIDRFFFINICQNKYHINKVYKNKLFIKDFSFFKEIEKENNKFDSKIKLNIFYIL